MKINYRQLSILVFMSFISQKLLALPSLLYKECGNMSWFVALVLMLIDFVYALFLVDLMKKCNCKNIYEFMKQTLGVVVTKIFMFLLMLKFALVIANLTKGLEFFVVDNLYNKYNWLKFILPLIAIVGFLSYKGLRNISRVFEMFFVAIIIGCIYIGLKAITNVDLLAFLPMFKDGTQPLINGGYMHLSWFGSSTFLIMMFGKVDFEKQKKCNFILFLVFAVLLVEFLYFVFYGLFDITAPIHNFALSDISQFYSGVASTDELSWLVVSLWVVVQTVQIGLYVYCMMLAFMFTFNIKNKIVPITIISGLLILLGYVSEKTINLESVFFTNWASILSIATQYVIPLVLLIAAFINKKLKKQNKVVKNEKIKNNI